MCIPPFFYLCLMSFHDLMSLHETIFHYCDFGLFPSLLSAYQTRGLLMPHIYQPTFCILGRMSDPSFSMSRLPLRKCATFLKQFQRLFDGRIISIQELNPSLLIQHIIYDATAKCTLQQTIRPLNEQITTL